MKEDGKFRVLVVDDEAAVLLTYKLILEQQGYEVTACGTGRPPGLLSGNARSFASARCRQNAPRMSENGSVVMLVSTSGLRLGRMP